MVTRQAELSDLNLEQQISHLESVGSRGLQIVFSQIRCSGKSFIIQPPDMKHKPLNCISSKRLAISRSMETAIFHVERNTRRVRNSN